MYNFFWDKVKKQLFIQVRRIMADQRKDSIQVQLDEFSRITCRRMVVSKATLSPKSSTHSTDNS